MPDAQFLTPHVSPASWGALEGPCDLGSSQPVGLTVATWAPLCLKLNNQMAKNLR